MRFKTFFNKMDKSNFEDNLGQMKIFIFMRALYA